MLFLMLKQKWSADCRTMSFQLRPRLANRMLLSLRRKSFDQLWGNNENNLFEFWRWTAYNYDYIFCCVFLLDRSSFKTVFFWLEIILAVNTIVFFWRITHRLPFELYVCLRYILWVFGIIEDNQINEDGKKQR